MTPTSIESTRAKVSYCAIVPAEAINSDHFTSLDGAEMRVLMIISCHVNRRTLRAFPSYARIAEIAGVTRRTAMAAVKRLESLGFIVVERSDRRRSNVYLVTGLRPDGPAERDCESDLGDVLQDTTAADVCNGSGVPQDTTTEDPSASGGVLRDTEVVSCRTPNGVPQDTPNLLKNQETEPSHHPEELSRCESGAPDTGIESDAADVKDARPLVAEDILSGPDADEAISLITSWRLKGKPNAGPLSSSDDKRWRLEVILPLLSRGTVVVKGEVFPAIEMFRRFIDYCINKKPKPKTYQLGRSNHPGAAIELANVTLESCINEQSWPGEFNNGNEAKPDRDGISRDYRSAPRARPTGRGRSLHSEDDAPVPTFSASS